jgi:hypothetical protein
VTTAGAESRLASLKVLMRERGVDERLCAALLDFAKTNSVELCTTETGQLPLSAAADAYAAVYVNRSDLSIALDPRVAERAGQRLGLRVEQRSPATWYVHVRTAVLDDETRLATVMQLLGQAFDRAFKGPRWERGHPDRNRVRGEICATCFLEKPVASPCPNCD